MIDSVTITPIRTPAHLDDADAADFRDLADLFTRALAHDLGRDHLRWVASEMLPRWQDQTYQLQGGFLARRHGVAVSGLAYSGPREAGARELEFDLLAAPEARGQGVEGALLSRLTAEAAEHGRDILQTFSLHPTGWSGPVLTPPTGFGEIPIDDQSQLYLDQGFTLEQVDRNSLFDLTGDLRTVRQRLDDAEVFAGSDYRTVTWTSPTPPEYADGYAFVLSRMSTDTPASGLTYTEEVWDAERVRRRDAKLAAGGLLLSVAAVVHVPTSRVVAYNELSIGEDRTRATSQWGTLVAKEHRGHRLGTIVKCANILRWRELVPASPYISTFNAEENRPMLDVNEALGFEGIAAGGAWRRELG